MNLYPSLKPYFYPHPVTICGSPLPTIFSVTTYTYKTRCAICELYELVVRSLNCQDYAKLSRTIGDDTAPETFLVSEEMRKKQHYYLLTRQILESFFYREVLQMKKRRIYLRTR